MLEPHTLPRLAGIDGLVHTVAVAGAAIVGVLPRAEPDDVRVSGIYNDGAVRVRRIVIEDRRPRVAAVYRLPQTAGNP